jgi:hypothetical protein
MMETNQNSVATADVVNSLAAAAILSDVCLCCSTALGEASVMALVKLPTQRGERVYPYVAVSLCPPCSELKDFNKIKRTLNYWLNEGKLECLKD